MVRVTRSVAGKMLKDVPQEKRFLVQDGQILKNLPELETALTSMADETFRHHAHEAKNDFSNWVKDVIGDEKLSRDLLKSTNRAQAAKSVASRVAWLRDRVAAK